MAGVGEPFGQLDVEAIEPAHVGQDQDRRIVALRRLGQRDGEARAVGRGQFQGLGSGTPGDRCVLGGEVGRAAEVADRLDPFLARRSREDLELVKQLIEAGTVTPVIDRTYPLREVPDAIRHLETGRARGKIVITV